MSAAALVWLAGAMAVFLAGATALRAAVGRGESWVAGWPLILLALVLYSAGNLMMLRLMREGGMAVAFSVSAILQLLLTNFVAFAFFGERPALTQLLGIGLGLLAVALILWPAGRT